MDVLTVWRKYLALSGAFGLVTAPVPASAMWIDRGPPPVCKPIKSLSGTAASEARAFSVKVPEAQWRECVFTLGPAKTIQYLAIASENSKKVCRYRASTSFSTPGSDPYRLASKYGPWELSPALLSVKAGEPCPEVTWAAVEWACPDYIFADPRLSDGEFLRVMAFVQSLDTAAATPKSWTPEDKQRFAGEREGPHRGANFIFRRSWGFGLWKTYEVSVGEGARTYRLHLLSIFGRVFLTKTSIRQITV